MVTTSWVSATHSRGGEGARRRPCRRRAGPAGDVALPARRSAGRPTGVRWHAAYRLAHLYCDDGRWDEAENARFARGHERSPIGETVRSLPPRRSRHGSRRTAASLDEAVDARRSGGRSVPRAPTTLNVQGASLARARRGAAAAGPRRRKPTPPSRGARALRAEGQRRRRRRTWPRRTELSALARCRRLYVRLDEPSRP